MSSEPVAWDVALRIARPINARRPGLAAGRLEELQETFAAATAEAERLVEDETGLHSADGPAKGIVTDRNGWVEVNVASFRRLLEPVAARLERSPRLGQAITPASRAAAGVELGLLLAWMSGRVLGQYDLALSEGSGEGDVVYFVGENIVALEEKHGFEPAQFRLWIALHEVTHRLQFTGVPWMRAHFLGIVERCAELSPPDVKSVVASLRTAASSILAGTNPLAEGGIVGLFATFDQLATIREATALMSLLEGHGDVVMGRAAASQIPSSAEFAATLQERRRSGGSLAKLARQAVGIEAKMAQYAEGERFVEAVEAFGGAELLARVWSGPEMLPSLEEIRDPSRWVARAGGRAGARA